MKIFKGLVQGSAEWLKVRMEHFTASEAPAMMGCSKYMTRDELLAMKKTGNTKPVTEFQQTLFNKGHAAEAAARPIIERIIDDELFPVTGALEGTKLLASFDGLTSLDDIAFEHKLWNEILAENVRNKTLEPFHYWQLEQQLLVSGAERVLFVVSDGTEENMEYMWYEPITGRAEELIAGWNQFEKDLAAFEVKAKTEKVIAAKAEAFPVIKFDVTGTEISSNIDSVLITLKERAREEMARELNTDQDFADKENTNKATKKARADLKALVSDVQGRFVSYSEFAAIAAEMDGVLQKMQSHGEKQVKLAKEQKKADIIDAARSELTHHLTTLNGKVAPYQLPSYPADFATVIKGKRNFESMESACNDLIAKLKIAANADSDLIAQNRDTLRELAGVYKFLFNDSAQLVLEPNASVVAIAKQRISDHQREEQERLERERERIRLEEEAKAKAKAEAEARAKEEQDRIARLQQEQAEQAKAVPNQTVEEVPAEMPISQSTNVLRSQTKVAERLAERFTDTSISTQDRVVQQVQAWLGERAIELPKGHIEELAGAIDRIYCDIAKAS